MTKQRVNDAVTVDVEGTPSRVFTPEHLAAVALETGKSKDKARLLQFLESGALDAERFQAVLNRHGLQGLWREFERMFLSGTK